MLIAKRVLRYLKGTLDVGVYYKWSKDVNLLGYVDSDYVRDIDDRKSTSGYVFFLNEQQYVGVQGSKQLSHYHLWKLNM